MSEKIDLDPRGDRIIGWHGMRWRIAPRDRPVWVRVGVGQQLGILAGDRRYTSGLSGINHRTPIRCSYK